MQKKSIILIIALVLLVVLYFVLSASLKNNEETLVNDAELNGGTELVEGGIEGENEAGDIFCTMDAMECPDGSFVGRLAPDCEFASCPTDAGIEFEAAPVLIEEPVFTEEEPVMMELIVE